MGNSIKEIEQADNNTRQFSNEPSEDQYISAALSNLVRTSRTAHGIVDTSASLSKASHIREGFEGDSIAIKSKENFRKTMHKLYADRNRQFKNPQDLRDFVEAAATDINQGITKEGVLIRSGEDSAMYPYTPIVELETAMQQFYDELYNRINNAESDSIETAAWVEYRIDLSDHFFADGCGKTAKAISSWILMRNCKPLPIYRSREELYENAPRVIRGRDPEIDEQQLKKWTDYYKSLF